jgi:hypothetical protein
MISLHAIGLGVVAGLLVMVDLRILGSFDGIPFSTLRSLMKIAWAGFVVNLLSGSALFVAQATVFVENIPFLIKIPAILLAVGIAGALQSQLRNSAASWDTGTPVSGASKTLASLSIALWLIAVIAGRLSAYL